LTKAAKYLAGESVENLAKKETREMFDIAGKAKERYLQLQQQVLTDGGLLGKSGIQKLKKEMEELMPVINSRYQNPSGVVPVKNLQMGGMVDNSLMGMAGYKRGGYVSEKEKRSPMGMKFRRYENGGGVNLDEFEKNYAEAIMNMQRAQAASDMASEKRKGLELLYGNLDFDDSMLLPDAPATPEKDILRDLLDQALGKNVGRPLSSDELMQLMPPKEKQYLVPRSDRKFDWRNMQNGGLVGNAQADSLNAELERSIMERNNNPTGAGTGMISPFFGDNPTTMLKAQQEKIQQDINNAIKERAVKTLRLIKIKALLGQGEAIESSGNINDMNFPEATYGSKQNKLSEIMKFPINREQ